MRPAGKKTESKAKNATKKPQTSQKNQPKEFSASRKTHDENQGNQRRHKCSVNAVKRGHAPPKTRPWEVQF